MVAYNFQQRFAPLIESGDKAQTIRPIGKRRHVRVGERLQLYTGMRTKKCVKLIEPDPLCIGVAKVRIEESRVIVFDERYCWLRMGKEELTLNDGFSDWPEMRDWFRSTHELPFEGVLIEWMPFGGEDG